MNSSTSLSFSLGGLKSSSSCFRRVVLVLVVDLSPFLVQLRWPLAVAVESGKYLWTSLDVMCGKPIKCPLSIALHKVSSVGENKHW